VLTDCGTCLRTKDMTFIFEESDEVAEQLLEKSKTHLKKGLKKDPTKNEMLQQMRVAWDQRREILDASKRFAGKTKEEQAVEYVKMVEEQASKAEEKVEATGGNDPLALKGLGVVLVDLSLIKEQSQDIVGAKACIHKAVDTLRKCVELSKEKESMTLLALALNAKAMGCETAVEACDMMKEARLHLFLAIEIEDDVATARQMLLQLRDMYGTQDTWCEYHKEGTAEMAALKEALPDWLAALPENPETGLPAPGEVVQVPLDGKEGDGGKRGAGKGKGDKKDRERAEAEAEAEAETRKLAEALSAHVSVAGEATKKESSAAATAAAAGGDKAGQPEAARPMASVEVAQGEEEGAGAGAGAGGDGAADEAGKKKKRRKKRRNRGAGDGVCGGDDSVLEGGNMATGAAGLSDRNAEAPAGPSAVLAESLPPSRHAGAFKADQDAKGMSGDGVMVGLGVAAAVAVVALVLLVRRRAAS
jgi:hypothetical protein